MTATDRYADLAGIVFQVKTGAWIDKIGGRHRLGIIDMNRAGDGQSFVIGVHHVTRTILGTQTAGRAFVGIDIAGVQTNRCLEFTWFSIKGKEIGVAQNFNIGRPTGLNQLRSKDSKRTVVGGKCFVQLGHGAAHRR